jgi:hypothetical protein
MRGWYPAGKDCSTGASTPGSALSRPPSAIVERSPPNFTSRPTCPARIPASCGRRTSASLTIQPGNVAPRECAHRFDWLPWLLGGSWREKGEPERARAEPSIVQHNEGISGSAPFKRSIVRSAQNATPLHHRAASPAGSKPTRLWKGCVRIIASAENLDEFAEAVRLRVEDFDADVRSFVGIKMKKIQQIPAVRPGLPQQPSHVFTRHSEANRANADERGDLPSIRREGFHAGSLAGDHTGVISEAHGRRTGNRPCNMQARRSSWASLRGVGQRQRFGHLGNRDDLR